MTFSLRRLTQLIGVLGTIICIAVFIWRPSFPTVDKLLVFVTFLFMIFNQGWAVFKRLAPFVALLLVYEQFRGIAAQLNAHVHYTFMANADRLLFHGNLPTVILQQWLWKGSAQWYDFVFYFAYMMHFVLPVAVAILIWKFRERLYWRYAASFVTVSFAGFLTFLAFPAAPPWMASQLGYIQPIARVSSAVFFRLGLKDFPSVYNKITPNPVAAVPSLHSAYATLLALWVTLAFWPPVKQRGFSRYSLRWLIWLQPLLIWVGTVYEGEHYVFDALLGICYALATYLVVAYVPRIAVVRRAIVGAQLAWASGLSWAAKRPVPAEVESDE